MLLRPIIILATSIFFILPGLSQSCHSYYPLDKGTRWVMESYDKESKYVSKSIQTVKETSTDADGMYIAEMQVELLDKKDLEIGGMSYEVKCLDGNFFISMDSFLNPEQMSAYQEMEVEIDGDFIELPSDLEPGMILPDAAIEIKIQSNGIAVMTMTIEIFDRQVEKYESITTPAGTFDCTKITYSSRSKMGEAIPINVTGSGAEWLAKETGSVKTEQYDKKQNMMSYTLLSEFSK